MIKTRCNTFEEIYRNAMAMYYHAQDREKSDTIANEMLKTYCAQRPEWIAPEITNEYVHGIENKLAMALDKIIRAVECFENHDELAISLLRECIQEIQG